MVNQQMKDIPLCLFSLLYVSLSKKRKKSLNKCINKARAKLSRQGEGLHLYHRYFGFCSYHLQPSERATIRTGAHMRSWACKARILTTCTTAPGPGKCFNSIGSLIYFKACFYISTKHSPPSTPAVHHPQIKQGAT